MNIQTIAPYILIVSVLGLILIATFVYFDMKKRKKEQVSIGGEISKTNKAAQFNKFTQGSYNRLMRIPGFKRIILNIRKRIETLSVYDEYKLRTEVMKIIFSVIALVILIVTALLFIRPSLMTAFWVLLGLIFLSGVLIDYFVYRVEYKLLSQLKEFNNRIRFFYQQTKMVDEAVYDSLAFVGPEMLAQAEHIYNILTHVNPEKELLKYEEVAPTRFLKVLAGLSLLVKDQGDVITDNESAYLRGLSAINEELNNEIIYRSKLSYQMRSMGPVALIPVFLALPLKNWSITSFPIVKQFYDSTIGFFTEVLVYAIALICYLVIRKMKNVSENTQAMNKKNVFWEKKLLEKVPLLDKVMAGLSPTPYTKRYFKLEKLLKDANSPLKIKWLTLHRCLIGITVFLLLTGGFIYAHKREETSALSSSLDLSMFSANLTEKEIELDREATQFDKQVINHLKEASEKPSREDFEAYIAKQMGLDIEDPKVASTVERINNKLDVVENAFFKWWELLIVIVISFATAYLPVGNLRLQKYLRYKDMDSEVHQILVLITILRRFDSMTVPTILSWMERFAIIFREPVSICLQDFDSGPDEALDSLNITVSFEPFQQIVERLKLCVTRISIKEAFDDIEMERQFYIEKRKEDQNRTLETRQIMGTFTSLTPIVCTLLLYLVIPMMYITVIKSTETISQLGF
ncbi:hypothetical protein PVA17_21120 [Lysinibacillus sp. CNPSo 3705]|uniref:hypothetical protein n=1 Tax=Lysinibacillus sp. CNPSo 3705 TaxID=3028148 RepID=UPI0023634AEF|nr:hypothetical protein [Lysinibacillus sp. CNPSo 3705]MDD1505226.1 hypothetical protein [Lysinibacillus sp. CNPSo 3705]